MSREGAPGLPGGEQERRGGLAPPPEAAAAASPGAPRCGGDAEEVAGERGDSDPARGEDAPETRVETPGDEAEEVKEAAAGRDAAGSGVGEGSQRSRRSSSQSEGGARFFVGDDDDDDDEEYGSFRNEDSDLYYDDDDEDESPPERQIVVGICAMAKKSKSKPMTQILDRLCKFKYITVVIFDEEVILNEPVENWPLCDCLVSFHSKAGFPLDKAVCYARLRNPFIVNDLDMQYHIQDRREVYRILKEEGIDLPRFAVLNRDPNRPEDCNLVESEDHVEINGEVFQKPFVEKPVCAEDHNVYIYYPTSAGGGSQRLFRKIGSRSSVYSPESTVRKTGSYIYEEFMPTDGTDVKVYTVGPDYAHAEARKSPALDGKVERDAEGKEVRYPVILNAREKLIARKVCMAFKQTVCGFDLLRANGNSYVCDVNGFSFVKNSMKYYDDCAKILGNIIMRELGSQFHIPWSIPTEAEDIPIVPTTSGTMMELRCVIAVIRHGDRTPKQKMKMEVRHPRFFELFDKYEGHRTGKLKLKKPKQLQEVLDIARLLLSELDQKNDTEIEENKAKLEQLKTVLEIWFNEDASHERCRCPCCCLHGDPEGLIAWYGHFSGINRKVQITYLPHGQPRTSSEDDDVRKEEPSLLLVLKWGGELTPTGRVQAEELGRAFRCMYPGGQDPLECVTPPLLTDDVEGRGRCGCESPISCGDYAGFPGCGLLRLHSTYRHDLKIYASDEGRVQMTAAAFAKGLLALEGELTPILVQMVKSANMNGLLDSDHDSLSTCQQRVKQRLHDILQRDRDFMDDDYTKLAPTASVSVIASMRSIRNPVQTCNQVYTLIQSLTSQIRKRMEDPKSSDIQLYHSETLELMLRRWCKLERDFKLKNGRYDISKIPDIYDCIKYDTQHNAALALEDTTELHLLSKALADIVIPQEYGLSREEKLDIAFSYCQPLICKIRSDLQRTQDDDTVNKLHPLYSRGVMSPERHVRTRLYFTSESHMHSLLSLLRYGGLLDEEKDEQWMRAMNYLSEVTELNYMTQIVIMLYEDPNKDPSSEERFHVELHFSPGVKGTEGERSHPAGSGFRPASRESEGAPPQQGPPDPDAAPLARDEVDNATVCRPMPSDPIFIHRRSPLCKSRKVGSLEDDPLHGGLSPEPGCVWVAPVRLRSTSAEYPAPGSPKSLALSSILASWQQVLSETSAFPGGPRRLAVATHASNVKHSQEPKHSGLGSQCAGLFSTAVLGGSSSAPNLQDYARASRKKLGAATLHYDDIPQELLFLLSQGSGSADSSLLQHLCHCSEHQKLLKRWSISNLDLLACLYGGFEGYSMVPSICPLETLHNSLSLKQMDAFLATVTHLSCAASAAGGRSCPCRCQGESTGTRRSPPSSLPLPCSDKPPWCSSGPSSAVSSAGPSSPTASEPSLHFGASLTSQSSDDKTMDPGQSSEPGLVIAGQSSKVGLVIAGQSSKVGPLGSGHSSEGGLTDSPSFDSPEERSLSQPSSTASADAGV
ncbi:inositol hexakisphosphate and diphosphoinositol-pentakisphosphate kinase 2-like isoform X1 [Lethenteron reissneri]|uniref:inositol hexakisphosphate and diphosphoinositol-pentakisphosphate kinase 2-like isoform X1 n=1 Tax=Lethenteron reissneri TaxID=7753 RepID=UPI002AB78E3B|nr:inositol hexakisphosphate and diphosphoinositol-pentakisphosphate kinase 2-like isoform X1 [Lethenteron reissneri]